MPGLSSTRTHFHFPVPHKTCQTLSSLDWCHRSVQIDWIVQACVPLPLRSPPLFFSSPSFHDSPAMPILRILPANQKKRSKLHLKCRLCWLLTASLGWHSDWKIAVDSNHSNAFSWHGHLHRKCHHWDLSPKGKILCTLHAISHWDWHQVFFAFEAWHECRVSCCGCRLSCYTAQQMSRHLVCGCGRDKCSE